MNNQEKIRDIRMPISIIPISGTSGAEWGQIKGTLADQTDLSAALDSKASAEHATDTGNPHQTTANQVLPSQSGNNGKFLTSDGTDVSWTDALPTQSANTEQLSANKTLAPGSARFQFLEPLSASRSVYLPAAIDCNGKVFSIQNTTSTTSSLNILVYSGTTLLSTVCPRTTIDFVSNGSSWKLLFNEALTLGNNSVAYQYSISIGASISSNSNYSIAMGYSSNGNNSYGVSIGAYSTTNNMNLGTALGAFTTCQRQGELCKSFDSMANHKWSVINWAVTTTNDSWTEALVGTGRCTIILNTIFSFRMIIHARDSSRNIARSWEIVGSAKRNAAGVELVGGSYSLRQIAADAGTETWDVRITTDNTYGAIRVEVKGESGVSIGWCASSVNIESKKN